MSVAKISRWAKELAAARSHPNLDQVFRLFPILKEDFSQRAGSMSGGQQQLLAIGRSSLAVLSLILLDEPSEGIQPNIVQR